MLVPERMAPPEASGAPDSRLPVCELWMFWLVFYAYCELRDACTNGIDSYRISFCLWIYGVLWSRSRRELDFVRREKGEAGELKTNPPFACGTVRVANASRRR